MPANVRMVCALLIAVVSVTSSPARAQDTIEIAHQVLEFQVSRSTAPPDERFAGTMSEQIHLTLPGATLAGGSTVIARVVFVRPIAINVEALQLFGGQLGVSLQEPAGPPGGSVYGTAMPANIALTGLNVNTAVRNAPFTFIGTTGPIPGGPDDGTIGIFTVGLNWNAGNIALDLGSEAILTGIEFQFQIPSITERGVPIQATTFGSFRLAISANIDYMDAQAVIPAILSAHQETPAGPGVTVTPLTTLPDGSVTSAALTFHQVQSSGETFVTATVEGPPPESGLTLMDPPVFYDIETTAQFTGAVRVCLGWTEGQVADESLVSIFHYEGGQWVDISDPTSRDTTNNRICGYTYSLSPFTLFRTTDSFTGFFQPIDNTPVTNTVKAGAAIPVKFSLGGNLGLNVLATGYPRTLLVQCQTGVLSDLIEETVNAGGNTLTYDAGSGRYTYIGRQRRRGAAVAANCN